MATASSITRIEPLADHVYTAGRARDDSGPQPSVDVPESLATHGQVRYLDRRDGTPGTDGPLYHVFETPDRADRYGFFCSNRDSTDVGSDSPGQPEGGDCGNNHLVDE